jgi:hypothetical protein
MNAEYVVVMVLLIKVVAVLSLAHLAAIMHVVQL